MLYSRSLRWILRLLTRPLVEKMSRRGKMRNLGDLLHCVESHRNLSESARVSYIGYNRLDSGKK